MVVQDDSVGRPHAWRPHGSGYRVKVTEPLTAFDPCSYEPGGQPRLRFVRSAFQPVWQRRKTSLPYAKPQGGVRCCSRSGPARWYP